MEFGNYVKPVRKEFKNNCPICDNQLDSHRPHDDGTPRAPEVGDLVICGYCGKLLEVTEALEFEVVPDDRFQQYCKEQPELRQAIATAKAKAEKMLAEIKYANNFFKQNPDKN